MLSCIDDRIQLLTSPRYRPGIPWLSIEEGTRDGEHGIVQLVILKQNGGAPSLCACIDSYA